MSVPTLEELARINPERNEHPPEWRAPAKRGECDEFRNAVESVFGPVRWVSSAGVSISQLSCSIPAEAKAAPANEFMGINLSKFSRLFTVAYEWDMKPEKLRQLVEALSGAGFR